MSVSRGGRRHGGEREQAVDSGTGNGKRAVVRMRYHEWQMGVRRALINGARLVVLACGARSGKDRAGNMMGMELMIRKAAARVEAERRGADRMIPRVNAWMVAPTDKLWQQNWDEFLAFIPPVLIVEKNKQAGLIRLRGDICIKFKSADRPEMLVSEGLDFLIVTEASRVRDGKVWYESLLPRLSSPGRDGVALLNGTPKCGKGHWYYKVWELARNTEAAWLKKHGKLDGCQMRQWKLPSSCNPEMTPSVLADLKSQMTERAYRCEIMAEFPDEDEKPFRDGDINRLVVDSITGGPERDSSGRIPPPPGGWVKSLDIARRKDATFGFAGGKWDGEGDVGLPQVVDGFRIVGKRLSRQIQACVEFEEKYPGGIWIVDGTGTGGDYFIDALREAIPGSRIIDFNFSYDTKVDLCEGLEFGVENRGFLLRRDLMGAEMAGIVTGQLSVFECEVTDKNKLDYHGPGGKDDDGVMSLGMWWTRMQFRRRVNNDYDAIEGLLVQIFS